ncbi:Hsp20 family protein [Gammaproteobacteria bacterium]|jgi:molecular chaperone IbpA|nr:Hsp20 family protein [Gammaproteobacteria bacterium]MDB2482560.1 Hsp20 family protein [Gammaproteobacteria bacterium]|tara:strand:+ start:9625 stop:10077 length:453 start_codon:yes stop_codon:yes gene_type:complete
MILNFTDPLFTTRVLGFEPLFDRLQRLSESTDRSSNYPPYNIRKDGNFFSIEIAVAGLTKEDIDVELANGVLSIGYDGAKAEVVNETNEVVYQGIAQRAFKQQFTLSEDVIVQGAELINGLLTINLEKIIPEEKKSKKIEIKSPKRISSK